ncbi:hypothetical protein GGE20_001946 [Rhizobium leguminosarum]|uniref:hypothetical protein n=1 Tax=Rhizobium leguminosarum TaxID=384 RepID=UPI00160F5079|nr:hypothetical protein [Rhizobium leguminosarum]MBB4417034.1 hypothetical protein [Rhizobium leguminosarum]
MQKTSFPHYHETMPMQAQENYLRANYLPAAANEPPRRKSIAFPARKAGKAFRPTSLPQAGKTLLQPGATAGAR